MDRAEADIAALVAAHRLSLRRLAFLLVGDRAEAVDAVDAAVERVLRRAEPIDAPLPYLRAAVANECRSRMRRASARRRREARFVSSQVAGTTATEAVDQRVVVLAALDRLPVRQRAVIVLRYYADLTESQTAEALGVQVGTVKSQTAKALSRLRPLLEEKDL